MNEELTLAIEELRQRPTDQSWFIPVLLDNCDIPNRRIGAGETLRSLQWVSLYSNWNDGIRRILSVIQPNSARVHELIQALGNKSARTRIKAADDLGLLGGLAESAIPALVQVLDDDNETVCAAAAHALGEIGKATELVIAQLIANIQGKGGYASQHVIGALLKLGSPGIHALINVVNSPKYEGVIAGEVKRVLSSLGNTVLEPVLDDLNRGSITDRTAYSILSKIRDPNAIPQLIEALSHKIQLIRIAAAGALIVILSKHDQSDLGTPPSLFANALSILIEGVRSSDYHICRMAIFTIREIGKPASKTVSALIEAMNDPDLICEAILVLGEMESEAKQAVPSLIDALDEIHEEEARWRAAMALGRIGEPSDVIVPALVKALHDPAIDVRRSAAWALGEIGEPSDVIVPALIEVLHDPSRDVRDSAVRALGKFGKPIN